jgi:hypothetical protein
LSFETHNGRSALAAGTGLHAPKLPFPGQRQHPVMRYGHAALGPAAIRARVVSSIARRRRVSSNSRCSSLRKGKKLCKTAGVMASAIDHSTPPPPLPPDCAQWPGRRQRASCSAFDNIGGHGPDCVLLHPGSPTTRPSTIPLSTMPHAFAFFLTNIGFTPRTSIFSVNACGRLLAQDPCVLPMERRI